MLSVTKKGGETNLNTQRTPDQIPSEILEDQDRVIFTTRHAEAWDWAREKGLEQAVFSKRIPWNLIREGTIVCGILPVKLVAKVCERGARYFHLSIHAPPEKRGADLLPHEMDEYDARLEEFHVTQIREGA